ncbi:MAG TPA: alpha/beta hydrolase [Thermomicrobiaceae bacterium]|nr:alpha/beta hydrolase [Thermomicrobiaceae bacterium]
MPTVQVNDISIYYEIHGEGPPVVLVCGLGGGSESYTQIIEPLAKSHRVLAFDNRGAGRSDKPRTPNSIELMASDTAGLMEAAGFDRASILGISMGGRIALALALARPEMVEKLVLVSTSARSGGGNWWMRILGLVPTLPILGGKYRQPHYAQVRQREASRSFDCSDRLSEIHCPVVIMHGRQDRVIPFQLAQELHAGIAGSTMIPFDGGHMFMFMGERQRFVETALAALGD